MRKMRIISQAVVLLCCTWLALPVCAELRLPSVISDHMVLQREKSVPIWGWADAGQTVTVRFNDQTTHTTANADGRWIVHLSAMPAGGPYELTITASAPNPQVSKTLRDIMVGEVWLCSGQSNMDMRLQKLGQEEVDAAQHPNLRLFRVARNVSDKPIDDVKGSWSRCEPEVARQFSAVAYYMGRDLLRELDVPVGLIHTAYGGTPAEAWTAPEALMAHEETSPILARWDSRIEDYQKKLAAHETAIASGSQKSKPPTALNAQAMPGRLYHAMLQPLAPYALRGMTWYQGESNVWRAMQYRHVLTAMIQDWRGLWHDDQLPFGIVQLCNYVSPPRVPPGTFSWAELRESQLHAAQNLPNVGLIVTIDVGNPTDIHPLDKQTVGHRLARWARSDVYGEDVVSSGPMFRDVEFADGKARLRFDHVGDQPGSGLAIRDGQSLRGFAIAGSNQKFRWAQAEIDGDHIIVWDKKITKPQAVRYAWDDNPSWANLVNDAGLPATPFRTDDWPGITDDMR